MSEKERNYEHEHDHHGHHDCCEHDYHHEHHDCCEHDHHHDHHDCCEHDHHHDHHDCGGHDHHHDHQEQHLEEGFSPIHVYMHNAATVASVKFHMDGEYEECVQILKAHMQETARRIEKKDGVVGHIKAYVREDARNCMISVTDAETVNMKPDQGKGLFVENANIVFGISMEDMEELLKDIFAQWI